MGGRVRDVGSSLEADVSRRSGVPLATVRRVLRSLPGALADRLRVNHRAGIRGLVSFSHSVESDRISVRLAKAFRRYFSILFFAVLVCVGAVDGRAEFVPTPLLVGDDAAPARIVVYHSLQCSTCEKLERQIEVYRKFLEEHGIAIEFRLVSLNDRMIRQNAYALSETMRGRDVLEVFREARKANPPRDYARPIEIRKWIVWYDERAHADGVFEVVDGKSIATTPTSFVLYGYKPVAKIPPGVGNLEIMLAPLYEMGYLKDEFQG